VQPWWLLASFSCGHFCHRIARRANPQLQGVALATVIASEAKQSTSPPTEGWIASSLALLAMTANLAFVAHSQVPPFNLVVIPMVR